jgi:hypothetical protein
MRILPIVLLLGCVEVKYVHEDQHSECDRGDAFVWTEQDGGTCGSFGDVIDEMSDCPQTLAGTCLEETEVTCTHNGRWNWSQVEDGGFARVRGPQCMSRYALERR